MVYLPGGPSHMDMYDMKPEAPLEYRGEFKSIKTNVVGMSICELMPRQATIANQFAVVRGLVTRGNHDPTELLTGIPAMASGQIGPVRRPALGCVVSKLRGHMGPIPPYVSVSSHKLLASYDDPEEPAYLGSVHRPVTLMGGMLQNLHRKIDPQFSERHELLQVFDRINREADFAGAMTSTDVTQNRALEMLFSTAVRNALDLEREPNAVREKYGTAGLDFLRARRLVEAGVSVVSLGSRFSVRIKECPDPGGWDTHGHNFALLRAKLPIYDQAVHALLTDLSDRGMSKDVAVVIWGEFGRKPRIGDVTPDGRGHWGQSGFAFLAGGGIQGGQMVGETDARGERPRFNPYKPHHVLATLYHLLGIDPGNTTLLDHTGRPQYLLDHAEPIGKLL
jgi:hypothetical protein